VIGVGDAGALPAASPSRRWATERAGQTALWGLIAVVPILVAAVQVIANRWVPLSDLGYTAVKSFDVFSSRSPLVGQWSSGASEAAHHVTYSAGPLLFWLLAVPTRWLGPSAPAVTIGLVNVASVFGIVALARRRGGGGLMVATAIALPLMLVSLPAETYSDPWNSSAPLFPLALLFFLAWSLACGEFRLLPLTVLVASFVAQCHLTYGVPTLLVLGVGIVGLAVSGSRGPAVRRFVLAAVAVAVICWSGPLIDQAVHRPGNLVLLGRAATTAEPTLGFTPGWHAAVHTIGVVPWWLREPPSGLTRIGDVAVAPGALTIATAGLMLAALMAVVVVGWRRRRADLWAVGALGLALVLAVAINTSSTPNQQLPTLTYTLRWATPAGMCVWVTLGWALSVLILGRTRRLPRLPRTPATVMGLVAAVAVAVAVSVSEDPQAQPYRQMRTLDHRVAAALPSGGTTMVKAADFYSGSFVSGLVFWLRHEGRDVVSPDMLKPLGADYGTGRYDREVLVTVQDPVSARSEHPPGRFIASLPYDQAFASPAARVVTVTLLPTGGG
jgi:hypothetical protein